MVRRSRAARLLAVAAVALGVAWYAASANAYVYWANWTSGTIGRGNLDGTDVNENFITGATLPQALAVNGQYIYWTNGTGSIGRANINGTDVNQNFIPGGGGVDDAAFGLALGTEGSYIYWSSQYGPIGRADLDGTAPDDSFFYPGIGPAGEIAVGSSHIYWDNYGDTTIGRANLDGSDPDPSFIAAVTDIFGLALGLNHAYVYWTNGNTAVGRASTTGADVNEDFITGGDEPDGVTVDGQHVFWSNAKGNTIGRANLDGSGVDQSFIAGADDPTGIAVDGGPPGTARPRPVGLWFAGRVLGSVSPPKILTITNTGHGLLQVTGAQITSGATGDFMISADTCTGVSIQPGGKCRLEVSFSPTAQGPRRATLELSSDDPSGTRLISLSGAVPWKLKLTATPATATIGTPATVTAAANNVPAETPYDINIFASSGSGKTLKRCKTEACTAFVDPGPGSTTYEADVGPPGTKPFRRAAIASAQTTVARTRATSCKGNTCT